MDENPYEAPQVDASDNPQATSRGWRHAAMMVFFVFGMFLVAGWLLAAYFSGKEPWLQGIVSSVIVGVFAIRLWITLARMHAKRNKSRADTAEA
jgi:Ca2+/H+ antiporter